jgi:ribosomal-protein-alanine N-acetyltransferase
MERILYRVRPMELEDVPTVMHIDRLSFSTPWPASAYRYEILKNPSAHYYIVEKAASGEKEREPPAEAGLGQRLLRLVGRGPIHPDIIGFAGFWLVSHEAHISTLAVHPDYRRRGVGGLLLLDMIKQSRRLNATMMTLEVRESNTIAQNLYRRCGFRVVRRRRQYYSDDREDALVMEVHGLDSPQFGESLHQLEEAFHKRLAGVPEAVAPGPPD